VEGAGHRADWPGTSGRDSANTSCFSLFKELGRIEDASVFFKMILVSDKQLCPCFCVVNPTEGFLQRVLLTGTVFSVSLPTNVLLPQAENIKELSGAGPFTVFVPRTDFIANTTTVSVLPSQALSGAWQASGMAMSSLGQFCPVN